MKNIFYKLAVIAGSAITLSSCVGLDTEPYDRTTDLTYWSKDESAAINVLNSCYASMYSLFEIVESEGATDNAYVKSLTTTQALGNGSLSTDDSYVKSIWDHYYSSVRLCNELLKIGRAHV